MKEIPNTPERVVSDALRSSFFDFDLARISLAFAVHEGRIDPESAKILASSLRVAATLANPTELNSTLTALEDNLSLQHVPPSTLPEAQKNLAKLRGRADFMEF